VDEPIGSVEWLVAKNAAYASQQHRSLPDRPAQDLAIVACMDARLDVHQLLGIPNGAAHIIRNAGGIITDDVIRSLCLSQRALGTRQIVLIHHTKCGLEGVDEDAFFDDLEADVGERPRWSVDGFEDPYIDVRHSVQRLIDSPFLQHTSDVHGFVFDVDTGLLNPV
jgi:carbonic anhydrase